MSTVHGIVREAGGSIWFESQEHCGTAFHVCLPCAAASVRIQHPQNSVPCPPASRDTILLLEDQDQVRNMVREMLESAGYNVLTAATGPEALDIAERHSGPIHLLLTDVVMPHTTGKQVAERLTQVRSATRVLYMSGYSDDVIARRGRLHRDLNYIAKPFSCTALVAKVREVLANTGGTCPGASAPMLTTDS